MGILSMKGRSGVAYGSRSEDMICPRCNEHMMVCAHDRAGNPIAWWCWWDKLRVTSERGTS
jgi:hypothetical protein